MDGVKAEVNSNNTLKRLLNIHCNWGWDGYCNGWHGQLLST